MRGQTVRAQYHYITPTAAMAIKVIFKLRVNMGLDLIATEPVSNKKERNIRGSVRLPALKFGNNQLGPGEKSGTLTPLVRAGQWSQHNDPCHEKQVTH